LALNSDPAFALSTKVSVDGPYGELSLSNWRTDYQHMILCGGGSGVTPMMSMVGELLYMKANGQLGHVQSVHLIWVASNVDPIRDWFPAQLREIRDAVRYTLRFLLHDQSLCIPSHISISSFPTGRSV
jgi:predicted ferric reductase